MKNEPRYLDQMRDADLMPAFICAEASTVNLKDDFGRGTREFICIFRNNTVRFLYEWADIHSFGHYTRIKFLKNPDILKKFYSTIQGRIKRYERRYNKIEKINLRRLDDKELNNLFSQFIKDFKKVFALPCISEYIGLHNEEVITNKLKIILEKRKELKSLPNYLTVLTNPTRFSFANLEEQDLLEIILLVQKQKGLLKIFKKPIPQLAKCFKSHKRIYQRLTQHTNNYWWIQNNYTQAIKLDEKHFIKRIKRYLTQKKQVSFEEKLKELKNQSAKAKKNKNFLLKN